MKLVFQFILIILSIPFFVILGLLVLAGIVQQMPTFAAGLGTGVGGGLTFYILRRRYCTQKGIPYEFETIGSMVKKTLSDIFGGKVRQEALQKYWEKRYGVHDD